MKSYISDWEMLLKFIAVGLLLLFLPTLSGCCEPCLKQHYETPQQLLQPTPIPSFDGGTNEELLYWAVNVRDSLQKCNLDKQAIKEINRGDIKGNAEGR